MQDKEDLERNSGKELNFRFRDLGTCISFTLKVEILSVTSEVRGVGSRAEHIFIFLPFLKPFIGPAFSLESPLTDPSPHVHSGSLSMHPQVTTLLRGCLCVVTSFYML